MFHCLVIKVVCLYLSADSSFIISLAFCFVKNFFILFFKFFFICISNSDIISCLQFPVNTFFIFFSTLFNRSQIMKFVSYEPNRICIFRCSCVKNFRESYVFHCLVIKVVCLFDSLFTLSYLFYFVKHFFQVFSKFFNSFVFSKICPDT